MRGLADLGAAATIAALNLLSTVALAQPTAKNPPVTLDWIAPEGCVSPAAVLREITEVLVDSANAQKQVVARAVVNREPASSGNAWRVTLTTTSDGSRRERVFGAESCDAIAHATALIVALMVDPTADRTQAGVQPSAPPGTAVASATAPPSPATTATAPPNVSPAEVTPRAIPPKPRDLAVGVAASVAADVGSLPSPAIGAQIAGVWAPRPLRFEVAGGYWGPQSSSLATRPIGGNFQLLTLSARGCFTRIPWLSTLTLEVGPCVGAELDRMSASGFGGSVALSGTGTWGALSAGALASWNIVPWFAVRLALDAVVPLARPPFVVVRSPPDASEPVHRASVIAGRGMLGAELLFF